MPIAPIPTWIKDRVPFRVPPRAEKPWYMPTWQIPRRILLACGAEALYRVWRRDLSYGIIDYYVLITSEDELEEMSKHIRYKDRWYCHFLWFYKYPSQKEWTAIEEMLKEVK